MFFRRGPYPPTLLGLLIQLFVAAWVLVGIFAVIALAAGWIVIHHDATTHRETIEIKTDQIKDAAQKAVDEGEQAIKRIRGKTEPVVPPPSTSPAAPPGLQPGDAPAKDRPSDVPGGTPVPPPPPT